MSENQTTNQYPATLDGTVAIVTGASSGFGRAIAAALIGAGATVVGVARNGDRLENAARELGSGFKPVAADATDPVVAARLIDAHRPQLVVLNAGVSPLARPLQHYDWESFSRPWQVDVRQAFNWTREALLAPLDPGSTVIAVSSGAARFGSPLSGGYAGAKATVRNLASYAAQESDIAGLGVRFLSILPNLTPLTGLGEAAVAGYAKRAGLTVEAFVASRGEPLKPEQVGDAVVGLTVGGAQGSASGPGKNGGAYAVNAEGVEELS